MVRPPVPPVYFFVIDVTATAGGIFLLFIITIGHDNLHMNTLIHTFTRIVHVTIMCECHQVKPR